MSYLAYGYLAKNLDEGMRSLLMDKPLQGKVRGALAMISVPAYNWDEMDDDLKQRVDGLINEMSLALDKSIDTQSYEKIAFELLDLLVYVEKKCAELA
ncbi:MAG TPA: hypothetical protein PLV42_01425 [bacterium]|nr:hypothetical protein [bacterium]